MNTLCLPDDPRPVTLPNDFGDALTLTASLVAEDMHFSQRSGELTVEKVYRSSEGVVGYGVVSAVGERRERRAYRLEERGESVVVDTGSCRVELPVAILRELLALALREEAANAASGPRVARPAVNEG